MSKRTQIEMEFDEPLFDVLAGFAALGYSRSDTAGIVGYSRPHFTRHVLPAVDPQGAITWPSRGRGRLVAEGIARRSQNPTWRQAVSRYAQSEQGRARRRAAALQRWAA